MRVRRLQVLQVLAIVVATSAAIVVSLLLGRAVLGAADDGAREVEAGKAIADLRNDMYAQEAAFWEARLEGRGVPVSLLITFATGRAEVDELMAMEEGDGDPGEVQARAEVAAALEQLDRGLPGLMRSTPGSATDQRLQDRAKAAGRRLDRGLGAWQAINLRQEAEAREHADGIIKRLIGWQAGLLAGLAAIGVGLFLLLDRARVRIEAAVRESERRFRLLVQRSSDAVLVLDGEGRIAYGSESMEPIVGCTADELVGRPLTELAHPEDAPRLEALHTMTVHADGPPARLVWRARSATGGWRHLETLVSDMRSEPTVGGLVLNSRDVSDRTVLEDRLAHIAFHDALTDLPNRALLEDRLGQGLRRAARDGDTVAVLMIDLDDFKLVNDTFGHSAGDELLVAVGERLTACLRPGDTVARLGGDEFAVLIDPAGDADEVEAVAQRIVEAVSAPRALGGRAVAVCPSMGIAMSAGGGKDAEDLLRDADTAMYAAKSHGKGRHAWFAPEMQTAVAARLELRAELEQAIAGEELVLHYQPIVDLNTGRMVGVEALVRWMHPRRGLLAPDQFVGFAEETGLIVPMGRWILREACRQGQVWRTRFGDDDLWMSVNVSALQLEDPSLIADVKAVLAETGLAPEALVLEITETVLMTIDTVAAVLPGLRALGLRLAIDDFGTGYSSLSYLGRLPVDMVKVDKSFADGITTVRRNAELAAAVIQLGRTLGLETVAEGIEQPEQLRELRALHCALGQGYLFAHPAPAERIEGLLRDGWESAKAQPAMTT